MPGELKPNWKRKLNLKEGSRKLVKDVNIEETLKALEQKEKIKKPGGVQNDDETKEGEGVSATGVKMFAHLCLPYCTIHNTLFPPKFCRTKSKTKSKATKRWMTITITILNILMMAEIIWTRMIIWTMVQRIEF